MSEDRINVDGVDLSLETPRNPPTTSKTPVRTLITSALKLAIVAVLALLLLIPAFSVLDLVRERQHRAESVRREIGATWGAAQTVGALVLVLPYRVLAFHTDGDGRQVRTPLIRNAYILPDSLEWQGSVEPEVRNRGIFEVPVYQARLTAAGRFGPLDFDAVDLDPEKVLWDRAVVRLAVSDLRGIQERPAVSWGEATEPFTAADHDTGGWALPRLSPEGLEARIGDTARKLLTDPEDFRLELVVRGTERLHFLPLGEETTVELASPWPDPGFDGAFLPQERDLGAAGFRARWEVTQFGRGLPQAWRTGTGEANPSARRLPPELARHETHGSAFGVTLVRPADQYQQTERSVKYAILFIGLTFTTLFLLELLSPVRLHPVHYLLVGFALCLFYLLLLALGEHVGFLAAYAVAAASVVVLITTYTRSLLGTWRRAAPLAGALAGLYAYLYALLRAADYSLLLGAIGLFAMLALVMYLTRGLDWWTLRFRFPTYEAGSP